MEIIFGLRQAPRELTLQSGDDPIQTKATIASALQQTSGLIDLTDQSGSTYLIPVQAVTYVQIGSDKARRVGFGS
ncbi:MAG: DUF3107 domain-containing protein [Micrococcales bacterium]|nr:DUF3107 domain-containing protein [Micrococcales bacterium]